MCKELKVLIDLSNDMHLSKRVRDSLMWAIQNLSPEQAETETSFGGWDFQAWPSVPDKKVFEELTKSRRAAKGGKIMTQAYIDMAAPYLHKTSIAGITVNDALKVATIGGWVSFKDTWVINEIGKKEQAQSIESLTPHDALKGIGNGSIKSFNKLNRNTKDFIVSQYRFGNYKPDFMAKLEQAGLVI